MGADSGHCQFAYPGIKITNCVLLACESSRSFSLLAAGDVSRGRTERNVPSGEEQSDCSPKLVYEVRTRRAHGKFGRRKTQANKLNLKQKLLKLRRWLCVSSCLACIAFAVRPTQRIPAARTRYLYSINCITNTSLRGSRCRSGSKINTDRFPKAFRAAVLRHAPPSGQFFR